MDSSSIQIRLTFTSQTQSQLISSQVTIIIYSWLLEADRFDKDFAVADRRIREVEVEKKHSTFDKLRQERLQRDLNRWDHMEHEEKKNNDRLQIKAEVYGAAKKNKGGSAYNIISLNYQEDKDGQRLMQVD
ncbi:MAG: hypothetical protein WCG04_07470 [Alphaproteobacteria bacterium]